ncbi:unnamed protein product [Psylliodes chrysocephalus]|uniref:Nucleic-acid-binding protein from transposon X-element n=1 Tax=Psylliodes chrysocephalus TaxID=3402493 RepID=A0A9P0GLN6_9CUCU|nr:unnamed protein product [Psylliodes chrysocephala]
MNITTGWSQIFPNADDIIIKTKKGNTNKDEIMGVLNRYVENGKILSYKESNPNTKPPTFSPIPSYSVIIARVEQQIDENSISRHLTNLNLEHRYCKRIIARSNAKPTTMIRIITGSQITSETLLSHGLHYHYQHYPVYPSKAPEPVPQPCSKYQEYTHTTENCKNTQICLKFLGTHPINKCTSTLPPKCPLPPKCRSCAAEDHQAWSYKCPKRPTKPIDGIPNVSIKSLNKKSREINPELKKNRIHEPITVHDHVINTYINKLNDPIEHNRDELLLKLRKRFVKNYNTDTTAGFSGNRVYILMFDIESPAHASATDLIN